MCWKNYHQFDLMMLMMLMNWSKFFISTPITLPCILRQLLWYNSHIKSDNKYVYFQTFSTKDISFVTKLFHSGGTMKNWNNLELTLHKNDHFSWLQLVSDFQELSENCLKQTSENNSLLVVEEPFFIRFSKISTREKLNPRKLFSV